MAPGTDFPDSNGKMNKLAPWANVRLTGTFLPNEKTLKVAKSQS